MRRDLTNGSVAANILHLAWPTALAMALQVGFNIADTIFVGRISPQAIAAVTMVFPVVFLMFAFAGGVGIGTTSLIARSMGSGDRRLAEAAAGYAFVLCGAMGAVFTVAGLLFMGPLFGRLGAGPDVMPLLRQYAPWIFGATLFMFLSTAASSIVRAEGDMIRPMLVMVAAVLLNVVLDPLLIFGIGPFPRMGIRGAAVATFISRGLGSLLIVGYVVAGGPHTKVRLRGLLAQARAVVDILRVGMPASANHFVMSVGFMALIRIVSRFGSEAVAAYGCVIRLNQVAILPCLGVATAVLTIVGQNVGAGKPERAESTAWKAALYVMVAMVAIGAAFFAAPEALVGIFSADPEVVRHGAAYVRMIAPAYMFIGLSIIMGAAFQGAGKGVPALVISVLRLIVLAVPGAYALSALVGLRGVWMAMAGSSVVAGLVSAAWFRARTWWPQQLAEQPDGR